MDKLNDNKKNGFLNNAAQARRHERASLISAAFRSIYALLRYGNIKTRSAAIEILLQNDRL